MERNSCSALGRLRPPSAPPGFGYPRRWSAAPPPLGGALFGCHRGADGELEVHFAGRSCGRSSRARGRRARRRLMPIPTRAVVIGWRSASKPRCTGRGTGCRGRAMRGVLELAWAVSASEVGSARCPALYQARPSPAGPRAPSGTPRAPPEVMTVPRLLRGLGGGALLRRARGRSVATHGKGRSRRARPWRREAACTTSSTRRASTASRPGPAPLGAASHSPAPPIRGDEVTPAPAVREVRGDERPLRPRRRQRRACHPVA